MADDFDPLLEGLLETGRALQRTVEAALNTRQTVQGRARSLGDEVRTLHEEVADVRDHITTLEGMIGELMARQPPPPSE